MTTDRSARGQTSRELGRRVLDLERIWVDAELDSPQPGDEGYREAQTLIVETKAELKSVRAEWNAYCARLEGPIPAAQLAERNERAREAASAKAEYRVMDQTYLYEDDWTPEAELAERLARTPRAGVTGSSRAALRAMTAEMDALFEGMSKDERRRAAATFYPDADGRMRLRSQVLRLVKTTDADDPDDAS